MVREATVAGLTRESLTSSRPFRVAIQCGWALIADRELWNILCARRQFTFTAVKWKWLAIVVSFCAEDFTAEECSCYLIPLDTRYHHRHQILYGGY